MIVRRFIALAAILSLCLPTLTWAQGVSPPQMDQAEVRQTQERLQALGFYEDPIGGRYGPETAEALRE